MPSPDHLDVPVIGASDDFDVVVAKLARYVSPTERLNTYLPAIMSWSQRIVRS
jgi:hypothetical protein